MAALLSRIGQEATTQAQPNAADACGLVQMILEAARTVRRDKSRCQQLARQVMMVGYLLAKLGGLGVMQDPRVAIPLEGLDDTLREAYDLVISCQHPESAADHCFAFALSGSRRRAKQFRRVQQEMGDYLRLDPSVGQLDLNGLQGHQQTSCDNEAHAPFYNIQVADVWRRCCWPRKEKQRARSVPRLNHQETMSGRLCLRTKPSNIMNPCKIKESQLCVIQMWNEPDHSNCTNGTRYIDKPINFFSFISSRKLMSLTSRFVKLKICFPELLVFHFSQLMSATNNFSPQNEIGRGGFGIVYKGQINNGLEVAVKRCSPPASNSDPRKQSLEFRTEIELLMKLSHKNLVKLVGYCTEEREMILVYEYMPNGSLDKFISGMRRELLLDWPTRFSIIKGIAQGLVYIHEDCGNPIVHRDIKSSNILLDSDMNPKITDFGTARTIIPGADEERTDNLLGTVGYLAPEYFTERVYSIKSDVYSFGIVLIEIVAGKRRLLYPQEGESTYVHEYARELWAEGRSIELIDPLLPRDDHIYEIEKCIQIGLLCIERNREDRPSMRDVLLMLRCESGSLRAPGTKRTRKTLSDHLYTEAIIAPLRPL